MTNYLALPSELHYAIYSQLNLQDIVRLSKTCSSVSVAICNDKRLWVHILDTFVKSTCLCFPHYAHSLSDVGVRDIKSWVEHAVVLNRSYANPDRKLSIRTIPTQHGLQVSWLKLHRGRWCLVASANTEQSELSMWEVPPEGEIRRRATVHLEAPVTDGLLDDSDGHLRLAFTLGTSTPYILVLGVAEYEGDVVIRQLAEIPYASHVRFFSGDIIGFAVRKGDDTYPYVGDWRTGAFYKLDVPNDHPSPASPLPLEPCISMTMSDGYVFTLHKSAVHIHSLPDADTEANILASLPLDGAVYDGQFLNVPLEQIASGHGTIVAQVYFQDYFSNLRRALVFRHAGPLDEPSFSIKQVFCYKRYDHRLLHRYCIGSSGRRACCLTVLGNRLYPPPAPLTVTIRSPLDSLEGGASSVFGDYVTVPRDGLPVLHLTSALDFDDGRGRLLLGTISGDVRLASFLDEEILSKGGLADALPVSYVGIDALNKRCRIHQARVGLDLPRCYDVWKKYDNGSDLPAELVEEVIRPWRDQPDGIRQFGKWTNDWMKFRCIWQWITPAPRWGILDYVMALNDSFSIRDRLQALSEIIPVAYDIDDHNRVVFRVAERMFYCRSQPPTLDDEARDDFEEEFGIILGVLPISYRQFLENPQSILSHVADYGTQRNLRLWELSTSIRSFYSSLHVVHMTRDYGRLVLGQVLDDVTMEGWSDHDWDSNVKGAVRFKMSNTR